MHPPRQSAGHQAGEECSVLSALVSVLEVLFIGVPH